MDLQQPIVDDKSGVSPVIGVILMVAVTVIIAAVIGSTVLSLGDSVSESPPQATFAVETTEDHTVYDEHHDEDIEFETMVEITQTGGEDIEMDNIRVTVDGEPAHVATEETEQEIQDDDEYDYDLGGSNHPIIAAPWYDSDTISSGDSAQLVTAGSYFEDEDAEADPIGEDRAFYRGPDHNEIFINTDDDRKIADYTIEEGQTVRVVWESGDQSQTLVEEEI